jgi:hypothetical protein
MVRPWLGVCRWGAAGARVALIVCRGSCNESAHQRIDRPLLLERPPPGRSCPAHADRLRSVAMLVSAASILGRVAGRLLWPPAANTDTLSPPCGSCSGHGDGAAGHGSGTATSAGHGRVQGRRAWSACGRLGPAHSLCGMNAVRPQALPDISAVAVRPAVQASDTRGHPAASGVTRRLRDYGNRSSGWRPLVGCSQRRWARASRAVRRPRSWPRT